MASALLCTFAVPVLSAPGAEDLEPAEDAGPAAQILRRAFDNRYELDLTQRVQLILRSRGGRERRRVVEIATKSINGRLHSLGRFTDPDYLRGTTLLMIENHGRSDDRFVYLPEQGRLRRVGTAQRGDAFMGTDFTYEDFERRHPDDYEVTAHQAGTIGGETVVVIAARPRYDSFYDRVEFAISAIDFAILRVRLFQEPHREPVKILHAPRDAMEAFDGHVLPTVMRMENLRRGTETEARFESIRVNPPLDDALFSSSALEAARPIPIVGGDGQGSALSDPGASSASRGR